MEANGDEGKGTESTGSPSSPGLGLLWVWAGCLGEQSWGLCEDMDQLPQQIIPSPSPTSSLEK